MREGPDYRDSGDKDAQRRLYKPQAHRRGHPAVVTHRARHIDPHPSDPYLPYAACRHRYSALTLASSARGGSAALPGPHVRPPATRRASPGSRDSSATSGFRRCRGTAVSRLAAVGPGRVPAARSDSVAAMPPASSWQALPAATLGRLVQTCCQRSSWPQLRRQGRDPRGSHLFGAQRCQVAVRPGHATADWKRTEQCSQPGRATFSSADSPVIRRFPLPAPRPPT